MWRIRPRPEQAETCFRPICDPPVSGGETRTAAVSLSPSMRHASVYMHHARRLELPSPVGSMRFAFLAHCRRLHEHDAPDNTRECVLNPRFSRCFHKSEQYLVPVVSGRDNIGYKMYFSRMRRLFLQMVH